jgi:hypothetical protein
MAFNESPPSVKRLASILTASVSNPNDVVKRLGSGLFTASVGAAFDEAVAENREKPSELMLEASS